MLTPQQKEQYFRDGFLLVPNVLTADEVAWLRAFFRPKFDAPKFLADTHHWLLDIFGRYPEVRWLCFHEPTLQIVRSLFGEDAVLLPESTAHFNYFGGWHKDTGTFDRAGRTFFKEKGYEMWTVAYYLQDNTEEYGGGLDVEPGTHREPEDLIIRPPAYRTRGLVEKIWQQIYRPAHRKYWRAWMEYDQDGYVPKTLFSIPSLAGDVVVFDSRLNHHATPVKGIVPDGGWIRRGVVPVEHEKLAIFSAWSRNNATARAYLDWNKTRKEYPHLKDFAYPPDFLQDAEKAGVKLIY
ncbi:MAG TPA: phytanoyl-CoA dioxygenase family protein [Gemmataceae bacterium]|nr:phytanoyl-CoA dioxygenase family protein [Gemmataceae bacterium]